MVSVAQHDGCRVEGQVRIRGKYVSMLWIFVVDDVPDLKCWFARVAH